MEFASFQEEVCRLTATWTDPRSDANAEPIMMLLTEEMGELARAVRKRSVKPSGGEEKTAGSDHDISSELGDMLFLLARVAQVSKVEMQDAASSVLRKIQARVDRRG